MELQGRVIQGEKTHNQIIFKCINARKDLVVKALLSQLIPNVLYRI